MVSQKEKAGVFRKWKAPAKIRSTDELHSALQMRSAYEILHAASERFRQLVQVSDAHVRREDLPHLDS
jgi:hypothetical protein